MKKQGPIWLGLTERARSTRALPGVRATSAAWWRARPMRSCNIRRCCWPERWRAWLLIYLAPRAARAVRPRLCPDCRACWPGPLMAIAFQPMLRFYRLSPLVGAVAARDRAGLYGLYARFRLSKCPRAGRPLEGPRAGQRDRDPMTNADELRSGKGAPRREFPVASRLIAGASPRADPRLLRVRAHRRRHRRPRDARRAARSSSMLDRLEADLLGAGDGNRGGRALRRALAERGLSPRHAQDLLKAFRLDVTKLRYADWDDLIGYCSLFGHAGRALRARRARREPRDLAGVRRDLRGAADHQPPAGLRARTTAISTASMCRSMRSRRRARASRRSAPRTRRPNCGAASHGLADTHRGAAATRATRCRCMIEDWRLGLEISVIVALARPHRGRC